MDNKKKEKYAPQIEIFNRVLTQHRNSSDKVYSIHQPHVKCIAKGKEVKKYEFGIADRGYKGRKAVNGVQIVIPAKPPASATNYQKQKARKRFRARAGIEPVIGHLKQDHRMSRNYLLDEQGDSVNTLLAAAGFNLRKMLQRLKAEALDIFVKFIWRIFAMVWNLKYAV